MRRATQAQDDDADAAAGSGAAAASGSDRLEPYRPIKKAARQKYAYTLECICDKHHVNMNSARLMVCEGRKVVYVLSSGVIDSLYCIFPNQKPTPSYRSPSSAASAQPETNMLESEWDTVVVPNGWRVAVIVNDDPWMGETKYEESPLNGIPVLTYGFQQLDEEGNPIGNMEWRDTPGAAFKAAYEKSISYQKSGRHNGKLYMGVNYEHPQHVIRERCRLDLSAGRYDGTPELKQKLEDWISFRPSRPPAFPVDVPVLSRESSVGAAKKKRVRSASDTSAASNPSSRSASALGHTPKDGGKKTTRSTSRATPQGPDNNVLFRAKTQWRKSDLFTAEEIWALLVSVDEASPASDDGEASGVTLMNVVDLLRFVPFARRFVAGLVPSKDNDSNEQVLLSYFVFEDFERFLRGVDGCIMNCIFEGGFRSLQSLASSSNVLELPEHIRAKLFIAQSIKDQELDIDTLEGLSYGAASRLLTRVPHCLHIAKYWETVSHAPIFTNGATSSLGQPETLQVTGNAVHVIADDIVIGECVAKQLRLRAGIPTVLLLATENVSTSSSSSLETWTVQVADQSLPPNANTAFRTLFLVDPSFGIAAEGDNVFPVHFRTEVSTDEKADVNPSLLTISDKALQAISAKISSDVASLATAIPWNPRFSSMFERVEALAASFRSGTQQGMLQDIETELWPSLARFKSGASAGICVTGPCGSGKSSLLAKLAMFRPGKSSAPYHLVAMHFFSREHEMISILDCVNHLARQLCAAIPALVPDCLEKLESTGRSQTPVERLEQLIVSPLKRISATLPKSQVLLIIIDGIDQCEDPAGFSGAIFKACGSFPSNLRLIISTRPLLSVTSNASKWSNRIKMLEISTESNAKDIKEMLNNHLFGVKLEAVVQLSDGDFRSALALKNMIVSQASNDDEMDSMAAVNNLGGGKGWQSWVEQRGSLLREVAETLYARELDHIVHLASQQQSLQSILPDVLRFIFFIARETPVPLDLCLSCISEVQRSACEGLSQWREAIMEVLSNVFIIIKEDSIRCPSYALWRSWTQHSSTVAKLLAGSLRDQEFHLAAAVRLEPLNASMHKRCWRDGFASPFTAMERYAARNALFHWTNSKVEGSSTLSVWGADFTTLFASLSALGSDRERLLGDLSQCASRMKGTETETQFKQVELLLEFVCPELNKGDAWRFPELVNLFARDNELLKHLIPHARRWLKERTEEQQLVESIGESKPLELVSGWKIQLKKATVIDISSRSASLYAGFSNGSFAKLKTGSEALGASPGESNQWFLSSSGVTCLSHSQGKGWSSRYFAVGTMNSGVWVVGDDEDRHWSLTHTDERDQVTALYFSDELLLVGFDSGHVDCWSLSYNGSGNLEFVQITPSQPSSTTSASEVRSILLDPTSEGQAYAVQKDGKCQRLSWNRNSVNPLEVEEHEFQLSLSQEVKDSVELHSAVLTVDNPGFLVGLFSHDSTVRVFSLKSKTIKSIRSCAMTVSALEMLGDIVLVGGTDIQMFRMTEAGWLESIGVVRPIQTSTGLRSWDRILSLRAVRGSFVYAVVSGGKEKRNPHESETSRVLMLERSAATTAPEVSAPSPKVCALAVCGEVTVVGFTDGRLCTASVKQGKSTPMKSSEPVFASAAIRCFAVNNDRQIVIAGLANGTAQIYDLSDGLEKQSIVLGNLDSPEVIAMGFDLGARYLFVSKANHMMAIYDTSNWALVCEEEDAQPTAFAFGVLPDTCLMGKGTTVEFASIPLRKDSERKELQGHSGLVYATTALSERTALSSALDRTLREWDIDSQTCLREVRTFSVVEMLLPAPQQRQRLVTMARTEAKVWDLGTWSPVKELAHWTSKSRPIAIAVEKPFVYVLDSAGSVQVFNAKNGKQEAGISISSDGSVVSVSLTKTVSRRGASSQPSPQVGFDPFSNRGESTATAASAIGPSKITSLTRSLSYPSSGAPSRQTSITSHHSAASSLSALSASPISSSLSGLKTPPPTVQQATGEEEIRELEGIAQSLIRLNRSSSKS